MERGGRGMTRFWRASAWSVAACLCLGATMAPAIGLAADLLAPAAAQAATVSAVPDWIVTIGGELRIGPKWAGAPDGTFGLTGGPLFSIRKVGTPPEYFGPRDSFGFTILDLGQIKIGPAVQIAWPRYASSDKALNGLGDVNFAVQAGAFAEYWPAQWLRLRGEVRQGFGGETGVTGDLFVDAIVPAGQFRFSAGPRLTAQSTAAVSPYFSITPNQSMGSTAAGLPALPVYHADGGFYSYGAGSQVEYFFNQQWAAHGFVEYQRLTGSAADSPLVIQRGSPNQFTFGLGATYAFVTHPWW
jgi:outer membrane protein